MFKINIGMGMCFKGLFGMGNMFLLLTYHKFVGFMPHEY